MPAVTFADITTEHVTVLGNRGMSTRSSLIARDLNGNILWQLDAKNVNEIPTLDLIFRTFEIYANHSPVVAVPSTNTPSATPTNLQGQQIQEDLTSEQERLKAKNEALDFLIQWLHAYQNRTRLENSEEDVSGIPDLIDKAQKARNA